MSSHLSQNRPQGVSKQLRKLRWWIQTTIDIARNLAGTLAHYELGLQIIVNHTFLIDCLQYPNQMGSSLRLKKAEKQSTYDMMPLKYTRDKKKTFHMWVINDK